MGGKSRKSGGVSQKLINRLKSMSVNSGDTPIKKKNCGSKPKPKPKNPFFFETDD